MTRKADSQISRLSNPKQIWCLDATGEWETLCFAKASQMISHQRQCSSPLHFRKVTVWAERTRCCCTNSFRVTSFLVREVRREWPADLPWKRANYIICISLNTILLKGILSLVRKPSCSYPSQSEERSRYDPSIPADARLIRKPTEEMHLPCGTNANFSLLNLSHKTSAQNLFETALTTRTRRVPILDTTYLTPLEISRKMASCSFTTPKRSPSELEMYNAALYATPSAPRRRKRLLMIDRIPSDLVIPDLNSLHHEPSAPRLPLRPVTDPAIVNLQSRPVLNEAFDSCSFSEWQQTLLPTDTPTKASSLRDENPNLSRKRARRQDSITMLPRRLTNSLTAALRLPASQRAHRTESCRW